MMRILFPLLFIFLLSSCHPDEKISYNQNDKLEFSTDVVFFDTIFTSVLSKTQKLIVYNKNKNAVIISSIELGGKTSSPYKIFIDGRETVYANNVELRGGDSLYILISVNIDPKNQGLPFLVSDSIMFNTNRNFQQVDLLAYGQDAAFFNNATLPCDTVWTNLKPFVITNSVHVAPGCTLTLEKGVRLYFHDNAVMDIKGTLLVKGAKDSAVTFSGDKFTYQYQNLPGQWQGIVFDAASKNNSFDWAIIKNALTGIQILHDPSDIDTIPEVKITNSIIENMKASGLEANGTDVYAANALFANCVKQAFAGLGGGYYQLKHCTFSNYSYSFFREKPAIEFNNQYGSLSGPLTARLTNCIVWGDWPDELLLYNNQTDPFDFVAANSILKTTRTDQNINGNLVNIDPQFVMPVTLDFHIKATSPAIDAGQNIGITEDLDGKPRDANPDIGAYEK